MSDQFAMWKKLLKIANEVQTVAEKRARMAADGVLLNQEDPASGFYRTRRGKDEPYEAVAIWRDETDTLIVQRAGQNVPLEYVWPNCVWNPISHKTFIAVTENGEPWPDLDPVVAAQVEAKADDAENPRGVVGNNIQQYALSEAELLKEEIDSAKAGADAYAKIEDDETLQKAQSLRARLLELSGSADKKREAEKKPHLEASRNVDAKWMPLVKLAKDTADKIRAAMSAWETEKLKRQRAEEAKLAAERAEAERVRLAEIAAAEKAGAAPEVIAELQTASVSAVFEPAAPVSSGPIKGAYGRSASAKNVKVVTEVTDWDALYRFMKNRQDVQDFLKQLAQRAVNDGHDVPGVTVEEQRKVA